MNVKNVSLYQNSCNPSLKNNSRPISQNNIGFGYSLKPVSDAKISFIKKLGEKLSSFAKINKKPEGSTRIILFAPHSLTVNQGDISLWRFAKVKGTYKTLGGGNIDSSAVLAKEGSLTASGNVSVRDSRLVEGSIEAGGNAQIVHAKKIKGTKITGENVAIFSNPKSKNTGLTVTASKHASILCPISDSTITAKFVTLNEADSIMKDISVNADYVFINTNLTGNSIIQSKNVTYGHKAKVEDSVKIITKE